jgi:hypothetical protein
MTLLGKVLPTQVTDHEGGPVTIVTGAAAKTMRRPLRLHPV